MGVLALVYSLDSKGNEFEQRVLYVAVSPASGEPAGNRVYPEGTRLFRILPEEPGRSEEVAPGFDLASPVSVAFDGRSLLLAGRFEGDVDQIWRLHDGSGQLERVNEVALQVSTPVSLPDDSIVFSGQEPNAPSAPLYRWIPVEGSLERITFGPAIDRVRALLPDGRIAFARERADGESLLVLRPDGTELEQYQSIERGPAGSDAGPVPELSSRIEEILRDVAGAVGQGQKIHAPVALTSRPPAPVATSVVDREMKKGWLLCLDANFGEDPFDEERTRASFVRISDAVTGAPLETFAVETDGSFFAEVPADRLLRLETLDSNQQTIARLQSGIWVRPNEHRGCAGCHEPRHLTPENRFPRALEKEPVVVPFPERTSNETARGDLPR